MNAGEPATALPLLRAALGEFHALGAPYETARTRLLFAEAARLTGDSDTAAAQLDSSRKTFAELGAAPELARLGRVSGSREGADALTARELEVLRLVSRGLTNRAIAASLTISEKTAANHVANILGKLGLSSRSAATAFAYEHDLV